MPSSYSLYLVFFIKKTVNTVNSEFSLRMGESGIKPSTIHFDEREIRNRQISWPFRYVRIHSRVRLMAREKRYETVGCANVGCTSAFGGLAWLHGNA